MKIIPVIDVQQGVIVRGVAGQRETYRPLQSQWLTEVTPVAIARLFRETYRCHTAYLADLDAIAGRPANLTLYRTLSEQGLKLWLDAGICSAEHFEQWIQVLQREGIQADLVLGLESLAAVEELAKILVQARDCSPIFSLDLRAGRPLTRVPAWEAASPSEIAGVVVEAGIDRMIVLDLADVGMAGGTGTLALLRELRVQFPHLQLIAGGGVRGPQDLAQLAELGCSAVLVASAIHNRALLPEHLTRE